jgi:hypothetical protein
LTASVRIEVLICAMDLIQPPPATPSPTADEEAGLRRFMRVDAAVEETMKQAGL